MGRRKRIARWLDLVDSVERVLALAERALGDWTGLGPELPDFDDTWAFRYEPAGAAGGPRGRGRLVSIEHPAGFDLADLVGVDRAVERLVQNTEQFVRGLPSNHVLLFGERGTGKSSAVRGLLGRYASRGLRIVEVHKQDLIHLPHVLDALRAAGGADRRFLIFCDDLSFDAGETAYRELKAALEGSLEAPPENVRVIATSNRRHLLPQTRAENRDVRLDDQGELHLGESIEEKLALSDRFGLVLGFYGFDQRTYLAIVEHYVKKAGLDLDAGEVREEALRWALDRSSRSGRTARQFVDDLAGRMACDREAYEA